MAHLQLSRDLLDLRVAHLLEQVEPAHEAELVGHADQVTCRLRVRRLHLPSRESSIRAWQTVMWITAVADVRSDARKITPPVLGKEEVARFRSNRAPKRCSTGFSPA